METSFFQAAKRGDNAVFKYIITILAVIIGAFIGQVPLGVVLVMQAGEDGLSPEEMEALQQGMDFSSLGLPQSLMLFLVLLAFAVALLALYLCIRFLHGKRFTDVLTGRPRLDWKRVWFAFGFWFLLTVMLEGVAYALQPENYTLQFEWQSFLLLLPVALIMLPLQTSFEEVLFRGYLMQGFGLAFKYRWAALLLTATGFGVLHFANPEVGQFGLELMMAYYIGFGLLMGICTLMDEGTELALGLHAATNIYGATIVSFSGSVLETPTIFRVQELDAGLMGIVALVSGILFVLVAARKYGWRNWSKLWSRID